MSTGATNDELRQASVRAVTGTALDHDGDWHALFDLSGVAAGPFGGRLLAWINGQLGSAYLELNGAMAAFALAQGAPSWSQLGAFAVVGLGGRILAESGAALQSEAGGAVLTEKQALLSETGAAVSTEDGGLTLME